jgi:hypothetical protein
LGVFVQTALSQEMLTGLYKNEVIENAHQQLLKNKQRKSTLFIYYEPILIPFLDDFSNYTGYPDTALWIGNQAFVNQSFCINPPTIGCATLDAVDEKGRIYEHASKQPFGADTLLSKPIRLDSIFSPYRALIPADSVSLCFFYQPGGGDGQPYEKLGDAPEESDSLVLEFGYQTGNTVLLYYTMEWGYLSDNVSIGDTIYSPCDPNLYITATQEYLAGDSVLLPCDSVTAMETVWEHIWSSAGMSLKTFKDTYGVYFRQVRIPIVDTKYFNRGFQFRFRNYASLEYENNEPYWASNVDFWHLDYIRLNMDIWAKDTIINDVAIVDNPGSILKNYTAMPWNQFKGNENNELRSNFELKLTNLYNDTKNTIYDHYVLDDAGNIIGYYNGKTQNLDPFYQSGYQTAAPHANPEIAEITFPNTNSDSVEILIQHIFKDGGSGDKNHNNDTAVFSQKFYNYYAYDDGTPEAGYLVFTYNNASLALEFNLNKPDTLRAVDIYVNHTFNDVSDFDFSLSVWGDNNGIPGQELYKSLVHQSFSNKLYGFQRFYLNKPVVVSGKFYVGYQTTGGKLLNVGFDQNNDKHRQVFCRTTGSWDTSYRIGTPMVRPVLGKYFEPVSICEKEKEKETEWEVKLYPNPAKEMLRIELSQEMQHENMMVSIYSVTGQKIYESIYTPEISLLDYPSGFYFLRLSDASQNRHLVRKFLIAK